MARATVVDDQYLRARGDRGSGIRQVIVRHPFKHDPHLPWPVTAPHAVHHRPDPAHDSRGHPPHPLGGPVRWLAAITVVGPLTGHTRSGGRPAVWPRSRGWPPRSPAERM